MKKELIITMDSSEKEIFFNIRRDVADESRTLLTFEGMKLSFNTEEMVEAIKELNKFYGIETLNTPLKRGVKPKEPQKLSEVVVPMAMFPTHEEDS